MTWIRIVSFEEAQGRLKRLYERIAGPGGNVDNIMLAHGLRPHTMEGHLALYKQVLHHSANRLPKWFLEALGLYVSLLNRCDYCVTHHYQGMARLLDNADEASAIRGAMEKETPEEVFSGSELALMQYARKLTQRPSEMTERDIQDLRDEGLEDGEILEANQVIAYFAYANRTVLGLGVTAEGDILGLSPSNDDDPEDWGHR